jgi:hypothetical protein
MPPEGSDLIFDCPVPDKSARYGGFDLDGPVWLAMGLAPNLPVNVATTGLFTR